MKKHLHISSSSLRKLQRRLPKGAAPTVHTRMEGRYTRQYIYMVLNGKRSNPEVIEQLLKLAEETDAAKAHINARAAGKAA